MSTPEYVTIEPHLDLFQRGYDAYAQSPLIFLGSEINKTTEPVTEASVPAKMISSGETVNQMNMVDGFYQSANYVPGVSGWRISKDGTVEFGDGHFRGDITGASGIFSGILQAIAGLIGGFTITPSSLYGSTMKTSENVGAVGVDGVIMDSSGLRGYNHDVGLVFNIPTDGNKPTFSNGIIEVSEIHSPTLSGGSILGAIITGGLFRTAAEGRRVEINSSGLQAISGNIGTPLGDDSKLLGDVSNLLGSGVLCYINNSQRKVPLYVNQEQNVADLHLYNRNTNPAGPSEKGDLAVVNNKLVICTNPGTPGTWQVVGTQS